MRRTQKKLKSELLDIKRKGAKHGSGRYSQHSCGRCQQALSSLSLAPSQCRVCKHRVCRKCSALCPDGSCLCTVCAKEANLKKSTGDWFYDQRVNRFSSNQGRDLVRNSLKKPEGKKRQTTGEALLRSTSADLPQKFPPSEVVQRSASAVSPLKDVSKSTSAAHPLKDVSKGTSAAPPRKDVSKGTSAAPPQKDVSKGTSAAPPQNIPTINPVPQPRLKKLPATTQEDSPPASKKCNSVLKSADAVSTKTEAASTSTAPEPTGRDMAKSSPAGSSPAKADSISTHSSSPAASAPEEKQASPDPDPDTSNVQGMFKKSDEEDEDIDSLVSIHKKTADSNPSSRRSSSNTMGSTMSIYSESGDYDSVDVSGEIVYSVVYDEHTQSLVVHIKEYVKCYLLPEKSRQSKRKTMVKRNTVNPVFNEKLKYSVGRQELEHHSLGIGVWHSGRLRRNAFLGEVMVSLDVQDLDSPLEECAALMAKTASGPPDSAFAHYKGELVISLKYVTSKKTTTTAVEKIRGKKAKAEEGGELHVLIKEAKSLIAMKTGATSDPFVKGYLFPANAKSTKRKTPVVKKSVNPHFDHTFVYKELSLEMLRDMCVELTVWDRENMSSNEFMGGVRLSTGTGARTTGKDSVEMDSVGEEVSLWEKMMQYPDSWAEGSLPLRSTM
ncbi:hypothetical protein CRUP_036536, partial [Coryphaenoides rupestris]